MSDTPPGSGARRNGAYVLGVDLGGTKVRAALADGTGVVRAEEVAATDGRGGRRVVEQIVRLARQVIASAGVPMGRVRATAVGVPGAADPQDGSLHLAPNVQDLSAINFRDELTELLGHPVVIDNDAAAAAVGERWAGCAQRCDDLVFVAVGTGVGMGIISGGRLLRGVHGAAGEIGFLPLGADPLDPANHCHGPFEAAAAGGMVAARYRAATGAKVGAPEVFELAARGDAAAAAAVSEHGRLLALAIAAVTAVLDPAVVVLGGGVGARPELLAPTRAHLARFGGTVGSVPVRTSALGSRASLVGAVHMALHAADLVPDQGGLA